MSGILPGILLSVCINTGGRTVSQTHTHLSTGKPGSLSRMGRWQEGQYAGRDTVENVTPGGN